MPELPEVETIKNILNQILIGKRIERVEIRRAKTILGQPEVFEQTLIGRTILSLSRRGKYLIFHFDQNIVMLSHLRMEGKFYLKKKNEDISQHARVIFYFTDNDKLCFDDSRCFGILKLSTEQTFMHEKELKKVGLEPFEIKNVDYLLQKAHGKNLPIKSFLLDQSVMAGLGNIYADEVLFASKIHPLTPAKCISKNEWCVILNNSIKVLNKAIEQGGSTIRSYHPSQGIDGNFQVLLQAYGKKDQPCPNCHHLFHFIKVGGRGTTFCPFCQMKKVKPLAIGLTGMIGAGKSLVLEYFKKLGASIISSDTIVHKLYERVDVIRQINALLDTNQKDKVDIDLIRNMVAKNPQIRKRIEHIVHPLVKEEIMHFIHHHHNDIIVCEVPLLFQSGFDALFDLNLAVVCSETIQLERLKKRNPSSYQQLLSFAYKPSEFYTKKADLIIINDGGEISLEKEVSKIFNMVQSHLN